MESSQSNEKKLIERLNAFIDAVIAIIGTVMVLELPLPHEEAHTFDDFQPFIIALIIFMISFLFAIHFYLINMRLFNLIQKISGVVIFLVILWLMLLSLLPFFTRWMFEDYQNRFAVGSFGFLILLINILHLVIIEMATKENFDRNTIISKVSKHELDLATFFNFVSSFRYRIFVGFSVVSFIFAIIKPNWAFLIFMITPVIMIYNDTIGDYNDQKKIAKLSEYDLQESIRQVQFHTADKEERKVLQQKYFDQISKETGKKYDVNNLSQEDRIAIRNYMNQQRKAGHHRIENRRSKKDPK